MLLVVLLLLLLLQLLELLLLGRGVSNALVLEVDRLLGDRKVRRAVAQRQRAIGELGHQLAVLGVRPGLGEEARHLDEQQRPRSVGEIHLLHHRASESIVIIVHSFESV